MWRQWSYSCIRKVLERRIETKLKTVQTESQSYYTLICSKALLEMKIPKPTILLRSRSIQFLIANYYFFASIKVIFKIKICFQTREFMSLM